MNPQAQLTLADGEAIDTAAHESVPPMQMIACLSDYIDEIVRCAGGDRDQSADVFSALSKSYGQAENRTSQVA